MALILRLALGNPYGSVGFLEEATAKQRKTHSFTVAGRNDAPSCPRCCGLSRRLRARVGVDVHAGIAAFEGAIADGSSGEDFRIGGEAFEHAIEELFADAFFEVRIGKAHGKHEAIFGSKAAVDAQELGEATN